MIKKLSIISFFGIFSFSALHAQTTVFAYLKDNSGKPIESAEVDLKDSQNDVKADKIGYFQFVDVTPGNYQITISKPGFEDKIITFDVKASEKRKDLGTIVLNVYSGATSDLGVVVLDDATAEDDQSSMQPTVGLLSSGRDVFANTAAFELGAYWFRPRGNDNRYAEVLFNGVPMSKNDDGRIDFSNWGGLNDVTRYPYEFVENSAPSEYTFGNLGGVIYYNTRASSFRKGVSLAYSLTNRSYFHRAMATYNTGLLKNGWAFSFSASRRWAEEGIIDGTYQDSYAYFAAIEKRFGDKHSLNLTAFGAPTYRANNSPNTQEVYDLMGKNYNSYWGWQDGEKRNERVRKTFEPIVQLVHYWKLNEKSKLTTTFSYQFGRDGRGRLDWFNAASPSPTYYRNLPSFYMSELGNASQETIDFVTDRWRNDQTFSQINWSSLYNQNYNIASSDNYLGTFFGTDAQGNAIVGRRAAYYVVEDVNKDKTFNFNIHYDTKLKDYWKLNMNFNYQNLESDNFRNVKDLLGADFALNLDDFSTNGAGKYDTDSNQVIVKEGDRIEYNYILKRQTYSGNISTNVNLDRWNVTGSIFTSYNESFRDGKYRHYLYADSKGKSDTFSSWNFGLKGRVEYKIDGKNFLVYNGSYYSLAPTLNEIFANPRLNNAITPYLENQLINSNDLSFIHRGQVLKLRLSGYYNNVSNSTEISRYFAEGIATYNADTNSITSKDVFVAEILSNVEKEFIGSELGIDVKVSPTLNIFAVGSLGQYVYKNNPNVFLMSDDLVGIQDLGKAYLKDYKVAGTPQKAASLGFRYNSPKFWWFGMSANYLADNYLDISAIPRTSNFVTNPSTGNAYDGATEELVRALLKQQRFDDQFMLNANAGKSFLFGKYRMGISVSVNNILNNRDYVTGGFESGRASNFIDALADSQRQIPLFSPKLWYDRGRTYFANIYLRF